MSKQVAIYELLDPGTLDKRYVGKSIHINMRYSQHVNGYRLNPTCHADYWKLSLIRREVKPILQIIEIVSEEFWIERERFWIKQRRFEGWNLVNSTDGGEGGSGYKHTQDALRRMRLAHLDKPLTEEHKKKISQSHLGKRHTSETREILRQAQYTPKAKALQVEKGLRRRGKCWTEAQRIGYEKAKSEGRWGFFKGKPLTENQKSAFSKSGKRIRTAEERKKTSDSMKKYNLEHGPRSHSKETKLQMSVSSKKWRTNQTSQQKEALRLILLKNIAKTPSHQKALE